MRNPYVQKPKAQAERFLRAKLISDHGLFPYYEGQQGAATRHDFFLFFSGMYRALS